MFHVEHLSKNQRAKEKERVIPKEGTYPTTPPQKPTRLGLMETSGEGIALIKKFEGCKLEAYQCSAGVWTIGYGHTAGVVSDDVITQEEADSLLKEDLNEFERYVLDYIDPDLDQNQFDALVAWTFNLGPNNLRESTLLTRINSGDFEDVPHQIKRWNRAGGNVLDGLIRRREAESLLWLGKEWSHI